MEGSSMIEWIVVLHVLAGAAWFGGHLFMEGLMAGAARTKDSGTLMTVMLGIVDTSSRLFTVAGLVVLVTGVWIVVDLSPVYGFEMMFVSIGFLVVLIGLGVGIFFFRPKGAALKEAIAQQGATSAEAQATAKQLAMVSHIMTLLVTIALIVMVLKPGL
jgi:uncharacterized membrane protein